jgi:predicted lipoprotein with Yx(FWY)xxD motif
VTRTRSRIVGATLVAAVLLISACSDDDEPNATTDTSESAAGDEATTTAADDGGDNPYGSTEATEEESTESTEAAAEGATVATSETDLGTILVDGQGNTLYLFTNDTQDEASTCTGGCSAEWPALAGTVTAGDGVDESLIGTVAGEGGVEQATYNGWPLYYYDEDTAPGDTNGQGSGGVWWVVGADGNAIES